MASSIPSQERYVDPFASYNSNVVNTLTQAVSKGQSGLVSPNSCQVEQIDSTTVVVLQGHIIKDDVLIKITAPHTVDITDIDQYVTTGPYPVPGYNYLILDYSYVKSKPPPEATIKILRPSERSLLDIVDNYLLLKVIELGSGPHNVSALLDYDPDNTDRCRRTVWNYASADGYLPSFLKVRDQGRLAYDTTRDKFYFGYSTEWGELSAGGVGIDLPTDGTNVFSGSLCYVDDNGIAQLALADSFYTQASIIVSVVGTEGRGVVTGVVADISVENGIIVTKGDILFLSETEAGKVTNVRPSPLSQQVGRSLSNGSGTTTIEMVFCPNDMIATNLEGTIEIGDWNGPLPGGYYANIDVRLLDGTSAYLIQLYDSTSHEQVTPTKIEIINNGDYIRVWQPAPQELDYLVASSGSGAGGAGGGGGGGGGGGTTDHSLLSNLSFGDSGHVGFAPSPHNNTHHSQTYITASGVTFGNLNSNGSVGTGGSQVAFGNHTHSQFSNPDIPSGSKILFANNTVPLGYTLDVTFNDGLVYITNVVGQGGFAKGASTWTQPQHQHTVGVHTHSMQGHTHGFTVPAHLHQWYYYDGNSYTWQSNGTSPILLAGSGGNTTQGLMTEVTSANAKKQQSHGYTALGGGVGSATGGPSVASTGSGGPATTGDSGTGVGWRPYGINFILATRN